MKLTREEVEHIAALARLDPAPEQIEAFGGQMNEILGYMDQLQKLDTEGVPPTNHATATFNAFREDAVEIWADREDILANAPEEEDGSIIVPKVV